MTGSEEFLINVETALYQADASTAALANGGFAVAWTSGETADQDIRARVFSAAGVPTGGELPINGWSPDREGQPMIEGLADGRSVVLWQDYNDVSQSVLRFRILESDGAFVGPQAPVGNSANDLTASGSVTALDQGDFMISFLEIDDATYYAEDVRVLVRDSDGGFVAASTRVDESGSGSYATKSARLADGNVVVAWRVYVSGAEPYQTRARVMGPDGTPVSGEFVLHGPSTFDKPDFQLTALLDGRFVLVWSDGSGALGDGDSQAVYAQVWNADGTAQTSVFRVNETTEGLQGGPTATTLNDGRFCIAWSGGPNYSDQDVLYRIFAEDGTPIGGERSLGLTMEGNQYGPSLETLVDGRVVAAWTDFSGQLGDPSVGGVVGRIMDFRNAGISLAGSVLDDDFVGTRFDDSLSGREGDDRCSGGDGNDLLIGGAGQDVLDGGAGGDRLAGNAGRDTLEGGLGNDVVTGGAGNDVLRGGAGEDVFFAKDGVRDTVAGGAGDDVYLVDGGGTDKIVETASGGGNDAVFCGATATRIPANVEALYAGYGLFGATDANVTLRGGGRADGLFGSNGNDTLVGLAGTDTLTGGAGADVFVFSTAPTAVNVDTITDFAHLVDTLQLNTGIFATFTAGVGVITDQFYAAAGATGAQDANDYLIYDTTSGALYYDADGSDAAFGAVQFAVLSSRPTLSTSDFSIVG